MSKNEKTKKSNNSSSRSNKSSLGNIEKMLNATVATEATTKHQDTQVVNDNANNLNQSQPQSQPPLQFQPQPQEHQQPHSQVETNNDNQEDDVNEIEDQQQQPKKRGRKKKTQDNEDVSSKKSKNDTSSTHPPAKVYSLPENNAKSEKSKSVIIEREVVLQLPLSDDDIKKFSVKYKDQQSDILNNALLEYQPLIPDPKAIIEKHDGEYIQQRYGDARSKFTGCTKCIYTQENSIIPCKECAVKFELENRPLHLDDALMQRAEEDAMFCRPNPSMFKNNKITETRLPDNVEIDKYDPNVISSFSTKPQEFANGEVECLEEIQTSPYDMSHPNAHTHHSQTKLDMNVNVNVNNINSNDITHMYTNTPTNTTTFSTPVGNAVNVSEITELKQFKVLEEFKQLSEWPKRTNVYCWWDCHPFNTVPVGIPIKYNKRHNIFQVYGCFCSFECAMAFKKEDRKLCKISNDLFYDLRKRYGYSDIDGDGMFLSIKTAMPRNSLSIFGGKLSIHEFRKYSCNTTLKTNVYQFPMAPTTEVIEIVPTKQADTMCASPPLRLKRTKPLPGNKNTLEHTLGSIKNQ